MGLGRGEANCRLVKSGSEPVLFPMGIWSPFGSGPGQILIPIDTINFEFFYYFILKTFKMKILLYSRYS